MATAKKATTAKKSTEVATTQPAGALVPHDYGEMAGDGMQNMTSDDTAIPFFGILQAQSPQVAKKGEKIEGAEAGMFLDSVSGEVFKDFVFIPCATDHLYVEWISRQNGGGFAGRHGLHSGIMDKTTRKESDNGSMRNVLPSGNEIVETFYVVGLVLENAGDTVPKGYAILAFTSSGITKYKKSIGELRKFTGAPLYAHRLHMSTDQESNSKGDWYNWVIRPACAEEGDNVFRNGIVPSLIAPTSDQAALLTLGRELAADYLAGTANVSDESKARAAQTESADAHF